MTKHNDRDTKNGSQRGSSCSRRRRSSRGAATSWRGGGRSCRGFGSTRSIDSRPTRGAPRWQTSSEGARSSSSTTSCSGPTTRRGVRPARRSRTGSTASPSTWPTTTSRFRRCRGRRSRSCRRTSGGWGGRFPGRPRSAATSTPTSTSAFTEEQQREGGIEYNYRREAARWTADARRRTAVAEFAAMTGTDAATYTRERPGMSAFVLEDGVVYHTYSTYARGLDGLWGMYQWLDRAPKGRNETGVWWRRHDEYGDALRVPMPAAGRCRWRGCGCPDRRGPAPRRRSSACGS